MDPKILNTGLSLAMEWGDVWLTSIEDRLAARHPDMGARKLFQYDQTCRAVMKEGHQRVAECVAHAWGVEERFGEARARFYSEFRAEHPWISDENLGRLFSQGCYYAMK